MIGTIIGNRYEIIENIGAGGMAMVYKGRCRLLNRFVAIKVLRSEFSNDKEFLKRFETEAQAAASLSHPNVVSVYDVGQHDDLHYIVMECIEGITLKEYLLEKSPLDMNEALDFSLQIAKGLEHAHFKGIIHHDIKPHNIIMAEDGILRVADFGLARAATAATTVAGKSAVGSVHYASPEQARGSYTDERSDIYSFGILMYEMMTGRVPFDGDTPVSVAMQHIQKTPITPTQINSSISQDMENIILKAIAKEPLKRYQSVSEIIADIQKVSRGEDVRNKYSTQRIPVIKEISPQEESDIVERPRRERKPKKKEDTMAIIAAIITSVLIIGFLGVVAAKVFFPGGISSGGMVEVPNLRGKKLEKSLAEINTSHFNLIEEKHVNNDTVEVGYIISQSPEPGERVKTPQDIYVVVSLGSKTNELLDYASLNYRTVEIELGRQGLKVNKIEENSDAVNAGYIIRQEPRAGTPVKTGETITLYVSLGRSLRQVSTPSVIGKTQQEARAILSEHGLEIGNATKEHNEALKNTIISQSPVADGEITEGGTVDIVISDGPKSTPTPVPETKEKKITFRLPEDRENVDVKIMGDGQVLYQQTHKTIESPLNVTIKGSGTTTVNIYFDDVLSGSIDVDF